MSATALTLGPVFFHWPADWLADFYRRIADEAPVERVTGWDTPYPHAYEWAYFPGPKRMKRALEKVMAD